MARRFRHRALAAGALTLAFAVTPSRAIVDTKKPVQGPAQKNAIPALPVLNPPAGGFLIDWPDTFTGALFVQEGSYSWAPNLASPPVSTLGGTCQNSLPLPSLDTTFPTALVGHLGDALDESQLTVEQLFDSNGVADFLQAMKGFLDELSVLPGSTPPTFTPSPDVRQCLSYTPVHARWLASQYRPKLTTYDPSPTPFREIRERGARLYCAAREAQFAQGSTGFSMGERAGFSVNVLGRQIDFFVTEPSLALDGPERFTGTGLNDGAQAFEIPLLLGTRITPVRGLPLPGFDEVRVPVSLVSADSELRNLAEFGQIVVGSPPVLAVVPGYRKNYHTVTHADLIRSGSKGASLDGGATELFRVGPLAVEIGFDVSYQIGDLTPDDTRVLSFPGFPPARKGRLWAQPGTGLRNHDGPWRLALPPLAVGSFSGITTPTWIVEPDGTADPFWREPFNYTFPPPLDIRLLHNDDHAIESDTTLQIGGNLAGELGGEFGPFAVSLKVTGTLTGKVTQAFLLRDALQAQDQGSSRMTPATGLSVRSRQTGSADLTPATGKLHFHLSLPFPLDDIDFEEKLFSVDPVNLAHYNSDDDLPATAAGDRGSFRLGTGSLQGDVTKQPLVWSHLPDQTSKFASFPDGVDACLADPTENPPTPPPCNGVTPSGDVPSAELCVYGPDGALESLLGSVLPPQVCSNIGGFIGGLALNPDEGACVQTYLEFLCSPVSKQQPLPGNFSQVVSHVLRLEDPADQAALANVIQVCAQAFSASTSAEASSVAQDFIATKVCQTDGTLLDGADILGALNPMHAPPAMPGPPCH